MTFRELAEPRREKRLRSPPGATSHPHGGGFTLSWHAGSAIEICHLWSGKELGLPKLDRANRLRQSKEITEEHPISSPKTASPSHRCHFPECIDRFEVNSPTKSSTYCLQLLIQVLSWRFCGGIDFLQPFNSHILWDEGAISHPHGGLRPVHQTSTCLTQLTLRPDVVQMWSRNARNFEPTKTSYSIVWGSC